MFGKFFASAFTGSMFGAGPDVFAVWGYVIANTHDSQIELNPQMLAAVIGTTPERIAAAIAFLCSPDERSRSKNEQGRRLVREGEYAYRVPNFAAYRAIKNEDDRRAYNRAKKAEQRQRDRAKKPHVKDRVIDSQGLSAHTEAETDTEADTESSSSSSREVLLARVPNRQAWEAEMNAALQGMHGPPLTPAQLDQAINDYVGNGASDAPNLRQFRAYLRSSGKPSSGTASAPRRKTIGERSFENAMRAVESIAGEDR